jgi:hypothetical protein
MREKEPQRGTQEYNHPDYGRFDSVFFDQPEIVNEYLREFERLVQAGDLGMIFDLDDTVTVTDDPLDPRESKIAPSIQESLRDLSEAGINIVVVTSRGAKNAAEMAGNIPGVSYIGSLGFETYVDGVSRIDPRFEPIRGEINEVMGEVYEKFLTKQLGMEPGQIEALEQTQTSHFLFQQTKAEEK